MNPCVALNLSKNIPKPLRTLYILSFLAFLLKAVPAVSWGRTLDLAKVKQCEALAIAWHVRCDRAAEEGPKHSCRLVPLRPALVLRGLFDVEPGVYQIM